MLKNMKIIGKTGSMPVDASLIFRLMQLKLRIDLPATENECYEVKKKDRTKFAM
jgi:hypothetical protein